MKRCARSLLRLALSSEESARSARFFNSPISTFSRGGRPGTKFQPLSETSDLDSPKSRVSPAGLRAAAHDVRRRTAMFVEGERGAGTTHFAAEPASG